MNIRPDQPALAQEQSGQSVQSQTLQNQIDSPEKHQAVIQILKDPQFKLAEHLDGMETLSPQDVATIWSGDNLTLLQGFPSQGTPEQKQNYLTYNPSLVDLIENTTSRLRQHAARKADQHSSDDDVFDQKLEQELNAALGAEVSETAESTETPEARNIRFENYIDTHFSSLNISDKLLPKIVEECCAYEDDFRLFEGENYIIGADEAHEIKDKLLTLVPTIEEQRSTIAVNDEKISSSKIEATTNKTVIKDGSVDVVQQQTQIADENAKTPDLEQQAEKAETTEERAKSDAVLVKSEYPKLKAELGSIEAVNRLLELVSSVEVKARLQKVQGTIRALQNAVPGKSSVVSQMIDRSNLDLSGNSPLQIFAGFLTEADKSTELSDDEKNQIRRVIGQSEKDFQTGSDAKKIAKSKEQIIDPETGEVIGEKYVHDSLENMAELRPNLGTYMDGERMKLATKDGLVDRDVTGWSGEDIGLLAEALEFHSFAEGAGITGMVESVGNIRFSVINDTSFDRSKIIEIRQVISALVGAGEGYDGDVFDPRQKGRLMKAQMRVLTDNNEAIEWNNDEAGTTKIIESMGLKTDGQPNFDVIKAFGSYVQENMNATRQTVQTHLHELFPDLVASPENNGDQTPLSND